MKQFIPFFYLVFGGVVLTVGDIIMKNWVEAHRTRLFFYGLLVYMVGLVFLSLSYKYKNIAVASAMLVIFNIVTLALVTWLVFDEPLTRNQTIGVVLSVFLIGYMEMTS